MTADPLPCHETPELTFPDVGISGAVSEFGNPINVRLKATSTSPYYLPILRRFISFSLSLISQNNPGRTNLSKAERTNWFS